MSAAQPAWRAMTPADIEGVFSLATRVHPTFFEASSVFADRLALFPPGSLVLAGDGAVEGYAIAYPIRSRHPPPLNTVLSQLSPDADALYLHDVALAPERRGQGLAAPGIRPLLALAEGFDRAELVSVYGTAPFWARFGFRPERGPDLSALLASYGPDAVFMAKP